MSFDAKAASAASLQVEVSDLEAADGTTAPAALSWVGAGPTEATPSKTVTINSPVPPIEVVLIADLPHVGDYNGLLRFKLGDLPFQVKAIRVARAPVTALPVTVNSVQEVDEDLHWDSQLRRFVYRSSITFGIQGMPDRDLNLTPELFELGQTDSLGVKHNASLKSYSFFPTGSTNVPAGKMGKVTLELGSLTPGNYLGKLLLSAEAYLPKEAIFSLTVRSPWWLAAIMVLIGASLSLSLKWLGSSVQPRLVVKQAISRLQWQVDSVRRFTLDVTEGSVLDLIQQRIDAVHAQATSPGDLASGWPTQAQDALTREGAKVAAFPTWANARRVLASITTMDPKVRQALDDRLEKVRLALNNDAALGDDVRNDLNALPGDIDKARKQAAQQATDAAAKQVQQAAAEMTDDAAKQELSAAQANAERASALLQVRNYAGSRAAHEAAGMAYYRGLVRELNARTAQAPGRLEGDADLTAGQTPMLRPLSQESLDQVLQATDVHTARLSYVSALESVAPPALAKPAASRIEFPETATTQLPPLVPPLQNTTREDTAVLDRRAWQLRLLMDLLAVMSSAALGVLLVWAPNPSWGQPVDLIAALMWGLGLYTVGTSTFEGILSVRGKLTG